MLELGDRLADGEREAELLLLGDKLADGEREDETLELGLSERLAELLGLSEAEGDTAASKG